MLIESFCKIAESLKNLLRFLFLWKLLSQEFGSLLKMKIVTYISQISETQFLENSFLKKNYGMYFVGCLESSVPQSLMTIKRLYGHKETISPVKLGKIGGPHWNRVFQHVPKSSD